MEFLKRILIEYHESKRRNRIWKIKMKYMNLFAMMDDVSFDTFMKMQRMEEEEIEAIKQK